MRRAADGLSIDNKVIIQITLDAEGLPDSPSDLTNDAVQRVGRVKARQTWSRAAPWYVRVSPDRAADASCQLQTDIHPDPNSAAQP